MEVLALSDDHAPAEEPPDEVDLVAVSIDRRTGVLRVDSGSVPPILATRMLSSAVRLVEATVCQPFVVVAVAGEVQGPDALSIVDAETVDPDDSDGADV